MNDELKEILNEIECYRYEELCLIFLSRKESNALLDYISNLEHYKSRCEKAIEYIKENKVKAYPPYGDNEDTDYDICLVEREINELLKILQNGSDKQ